LNLNPSLGNFQKINLNIFYRIIVESLEEDLILLRLWEEVRIWVN